MKSESETHYVLGTYNGTEPGKRLRTAVFKYQNGKYWKVTQVGMHWIKQFKNPSSPPRIFKRWNYPPSSQDVFKARQNVPIAPELIRNPNGTWAVYLGDKLHSDGWRSPAIATEAANQYVMGFVIG